MRRRRRVRSAFRRKRRAPTNRTLNKKIKAMKQKQEVKQHFITHSGSNTPSATPSIAALNNIAVGDTNETREGDFITCTSIQWRGVFTPATSCAVSQSVRHIVLWDTQCNGSTLNAVTALLDTNSPFSAYLTQQVTPRFKVIFDKIYTLVSPSDAITPTVNIRKTINKQKYSFSRRVTFNTPISTDVPQANELVSIVMTDAATNGVNFDLRFKVCFKDD